MDITTKHFSILEPILEDTGPVLEHTDSELNLCLYMSSTSHNVCEKKYESLLRILHNTYPSRFQVIDAAL